VDATTGSRKAVRREVQRAIGRRCAARWTFGGPRVSDWSSSQQTEPTRVQRLLQSPLTDSNRRPPPYHPSPGATGCNPRQRFPRVFASFGRGRFATDCHCLQPRGSIRAPSFVIRPDNGHRRLSSTWTPSLSERWSCLGAGLLWVAMPGEASRCERDERVTKATPVCREPPQSNQMSAAFGHIHAWRNGPSARPQTWRWWVPGLSLVLPAAR
jgi:hypothetical protein